VVKPPPQKDFPRLELPGYPLGRSLDVIYGGLQVHQGTGPARPLDQRFHNCGAVDGDEWAAATRTQLVNLANYLYFEMQQMD
jgi:hypothetical protein